MEKITVSFLHRLYCRY